MNILFRFAAVALAAAICSAQTSALGDDAIILAGGGYRTPLPGLAVAPGQLAVVHVHGVKTAIEAAIPGIVGPNGMPHVLGGVSVDLIQGNDAKATSLELRGIYQTYCLEPCSPVTAITVQIPFELETQLTGRSPWLRISENGKVVGGVLLAPVADNIHVLNTCDDAQVYISAAYSVPQNVCAADVMHGGLMNSLYNLAHGGDGAALWAYGLGATTERKEPCCATPEELPRPLQNVQLNFDFRPNAPAAPALAGFGVTGAPAFTAYVGGGVYQVNFTVPPVPAGTPACDGVKIKSNLTVTVTGPNSYDAAQICVAP